MVRWRDTRTVSFAEIFKRAQEHRKDENCVTRKALSNLLERYPDDMEVTVSCDQLSRNITNVVKVTELGTNNVAIDIQVENKPSLDEIVRQVKENMYISKYE